MRGLLFGVFRVLLSVSVQRVLQRRKRAQSSSSGCFDTRSDRLRPLSSQHNSATQD